MDRSVELSRETDGAAFHILKRHTCQTICQIHPFDIDGIFWGPVAIPIL